MRTNAPKNLEPEVRNERRSRARKAHVGSQENKYVCNFNAAKHNESSPHERDTDKPLRTCSLAFRTYSAYERTTSSLKQYTLNAEQLTAKKKKNEKTVFCNNLDQKTLIFEICH